MWVMGVRIKVLIACEVVFHDGTFISDLLLVF